MKHTAPSDETCERAWDEIMRLAREHCLVVDAYGGTASLATPDAQREAGIRDGVLFAHNSTERPER